MHTHDHKKSTIKKIRNAFFLNLFFTVFEIIGGLYTNSIAILSDALHDFGDSISLGLAWYLERFSLKKPTNTYTFGYRRFSLLGALINAMVLCIGSIFIISESIPRLTNPEMPDTDGMLIIAIIGVVINGLAVLQTRSGTSLNQKVISWHLMEDVLGWIAVLIVSIVLRFYDLPILDPILSIAILVYVLTNVIRHLISALKILLQAAPEDIDLVKIKEQILETSEISGIQEFRIWTIDGEEHVVNITITVTNNPDVLELTRIKKTIRGILKDNHVVYSTIEIATEAKLE